MDVAANHVSAGLAERITQRRARLLQAEILLVVAGAENVDVVDDIVLVGEDGAVALRQRQRALVEHQAALHDRDGGGGLRADDRSQQERDAGRYWRTKLHGEPLFKETDDRAELESQGRPDAEIEVVVVAGASRGAVEG